MSRDAGGDTLSYDIRQKIRWEESYVTGREKKYGNSYVLSVMSRDVRRFTGILTSYVLRHGAPKNEVQTLLAQQRM